MAGDAGLPEHSTARSPADPGTPQGRRAQGARPGRPQIAQIAYQAGLDLVMILDMSAKGSRPTPPRRGCGFPGCPNPHRAHGLCSSHLDQLARGKALSPLLGRHGRKHDRCSFPSCDKPHHANGLCHGHDLQRKRGEQLKPLGRQGSGWFLDEKGYVWVRAPDHPNAKRHPSGKGRTGYVQEHILVMSAKLGRPLRPGETVHHRNLLRWDNRPENLELWTGGQPKGARVEDLVAWARWLLEEYGEEFRD